MTYWYGLDTFVVTCADIDRAKDFLEENFGLVFIKEQHKGGPEHYACERGGKVLEIYPED